jgi:hypothetical protein
MLPKESTLKKEFKKSDVQRMRNLITGKSGDRTQILGGWESKKEDHKEGDVWEEDGKQWTIKSGIKQSITKLDKFKHLVHLPLSCPNCQKSMKDDDITKKMYAIHRMCLDCVVKMEDKIKAEGRWDDYAKNIMNSNKNASLEEFEDALDSWLQEKDTYISEAGDIESWQGGDKTKIYQEIKQKLDELKRTDIY